MLTRLVPARSRRAVDAAASGSTGELFRSAQVDRVRVFVNVPQENAAFVAAGRDARVYVEAFEVAFENARRGTPLLVPGEAVVARADGLHIATIESLHDHERRELGKQQRGKMKDEDIRRVRRIHLQDVRVGRDYGTDIEIVQGLREGAVIVANPGDGIVEGAQVPPHAQE